MTEEALPEEEAPVDEPAGDADNTQADTSEEEPETDAADLPDDVPVGDPSAGDDTPDEVE